MATNIDPNWSRWAFASISEHFLELREGLPLHITGTAFIQPEEEDFLELRVDGPYLREYSHGYWRYYTEISILVQSHMNDQDFHKIHRDVGIVQVAMNTPIPVFKHGDGLEDTSEKIGCLDLLRATRGKHKLEVNHFGQTGPRNKLMQATVEGHFEMFICTE